MKDLSISPNRLLADIGFWGSQKRFLLMVLLGVLLISVLFSLTYPRSDTLLAYLSILIHFIALWGTAVTAKIIAKIHLEHAISMSVDETAAEELRQIKSGKKDRIALERIEEDYLPYNEDSGMIRLFQQILKEAKDRKFESSVNIMQPYREESIGDILKLQTIQKIALQLGILGTFIGLILALSQLSLTQNLNEIGGFEPLFESLHISFGTSIAGLEVSVLIGFLIMLVRRKQEAYFQSMESATVTMISLARNALNKDELATEFSGIRHEINQLNDSVYDQTQKLEKQTDVMQAGMKKLASARSDLEGFLAQITDEQRQFIDDMKNLYDILSPERINKELETGLTNVVEGLAHTFNTNLTASLGKLAELNTSLSLLNDSLGKVDSQLKEQAKWMQTGNEELRETKSEFYAALQKMTESQTRFTDETRLGIEHITGQLQDSISHAGDNISSHIKYDLKSMSQQMTTLNHQLEEFNRYIQAQNIYKPLYRIIFEKLGLIRRFFSNLFWRIRQRF